MLGTGYMYKDPTPAQLLVMAHLQNAFFYSHHTLSHLLATALPRDRNMQVPVAGGVRRADPAAVAQASHAKENAALFATELARVRAKIEADPVYIEDATLAILLQISRTVVFSQTKIGGRIGIFMKVRKRKQT